MDNETTSPQGSAPWWKGMLRDPEWSIARRVALFNLVLACLISALFMAHRGFFWRVPVLVGAGTLSACFAVGLTEEEHRRGR